jgi:hypothetical protein
VLLPEGAERGDSDDAHDPNIVPKWDYRKERHGRAGGSGDARRRR